MTSTQQSEAMQAVRLLYRYAVKGSEGAEPENIYRARVLLEGFIEGAGVLEGKNTDEFSPGFVTKNGSFSVGENVYTLRDNRTRCAYSPRRIARINLIDQTITTEQGDWGMDFQQSIDYFMELNPNGSFK